MAMGTRKDQEQQEELGIPQAWLAKGASHPFYQRSIQILDEKKFDKYVEAICERFLRRRSGPADVMF